MDEEGMQEKRSNDGRSQHERSARLIVKIQVEFTL